MAKEDSSVFSRVLTMAIPFEEICVSKSNKPRVTKYDDYAFFIDIPLMLTVVFSR